MERIKPITSPLHAVRVILKRETDIPTRLKVISVNVFSLHFVPRKKPLKDAQAVNTIRWKIVETLKATGLPVIYGTGGKTKWQRKQAGLPKTHYYDAACVAGVAKSSTSHSVLAIHAVGYGHRGDLGLYQTKQKAPGFKSSYKRIEHSGGFQKLDTVEMTTKNGKFVGCINTFDNTLDGRPQKLRIKTDWTDGSCPSHPGMPQQPVPATPDKIPPQGYHQSPPSPSRPSDTPQ